MNRVVDQRHGVRFDRPVLPVILSLAASLADDRGWLRTATASLLVLSGCLMFGFLLSPVRIAADDAPIGNESVPNSRTASGEALEPARIAVLATPHLSGAPQDFEVEMLAPVIERLAAFSPNLILVEEPAPEHLRFLQRESDRYPGLAEQFGPRAQALSELAAASVGLSPAAAEMRADRLAVDSPEALRQAVALRARAGDAASAVAYWKRLPGAARQAGGAIGDALADELDRLAADRNETYSIGSELAARLGHGAVFGFDDWHAGDLFLGAVPALREAMEEDPALKSAADSDLVVQSSQRIAAMTSTEAVLASYRYFNEAAPQRDRARAEWNPFLAVRSHPDAAWARLASWEARNLRMAAHIVEAAGRRPGQRILVIAGASHKPFLENALRGIAGVEIVSSETLLEVQ